MMVPPWSRIHARHASWLHTKQPRTFTWKVLSQAPSSASIVAPMLGLVAALLTRMSRAPSCSTQAATHAAAWSGSPALAAMVASCAPGVASRIAAAASSRPSCLRDESITAAPASANEAAMARPMPFEAPVTSAT